MFVANGKGSDESISSFEGTLGFNLPEDYRKFLLATNGGTYQNAVIRLQRPGELLIDNLFGLGVQRELALDFWKDEFDDEIPDKSLIIGSDAGGGFILLSVKAGMEGVYYYDHSYSFPGSNDEENTYFIGANFSEFLAGIQGPENRVQ